MKPGIRELVAGTLSWMLVPCLAGAQSPVIQSVDGSAFFAPSQVTIVGSNFDAGTTVALDGVPEPVVSQTPTELVIAPSFGAPGFADVTVTNASGSTTLQDGLELWPTLRAESTGLGGFLTVELGNGDAGTYWAVLGSAPFPFAVTLPGIEHGLQINLSVANVTLELGTFGATSAALVAKPIPNDPDLAGVQVFLQSLHEVGASPGSTLSFSNLVGLALAPERPGGLTYSQNPAMYEVGTPIAPNVPSSTGGVDFYSIAPGAPAGLSFDTETGILTGTPTAESSADHVVTAHNVLGTTTTVLQLSAHVPFQIVNCSLGCNTFQSSQVSCNLNDVFVNEEISIEFSAPVDFSTVNQATFQVQQTATGLVPPALFLPDAADPNRIVYKALLTFDSSGNPVFGLEQGLSYEIFLPGANLDVGPYITSTTGRPLEVRMRCIVTAGAGIQDEVPGPPSVVTTVDVVTGYDPMTGLPNSFANDVPANGATNVFADSPIRFAFDDVMNPATLVNPVTGQSPTISVALDADGNLATTADQTPVAGSFAISIDQGAKSTEVSFAPDSSFPPAGAPPSRIVVTIGAGIVDLGSNPLIVRGPISFVPES